MMHEIFKKQHATFKSIVGRGQDAMYKAQKKFEPTNSGNYRINFESVEQRVLGPDLSEKP